MTPRNLRRTPPPPDCPLDACLKFLSSTWTARILWFLSCGPRRFGDLRRDRGSISPKVLTQRLRAMEAHGLLSRRKLPTRPVQVEYHLTAAGHAFKPVLDAMVEVAIELRREETSC
jgi:DNA-binding HxlR family transcriptional regulator